MVYVSTGGEQSRTAVETAVEYFNNGIHFVELSGGLFSRDIERQLLSLPAKLQLQIHNYFPPPQKPFVFNLASTDSEISSLSLSHVRKAIRLAVMLKRPIYSFHAGFRIDPGVSELGTLLSKRKMLERYKALEVFGDRIETLAEEARREGVTLLIENNVINYKNFEKYGEDPLLLTHPDEISSFMESMPSSVGLLLDVAHLKVSANTRSFNLVAAHEKVKGWIKGYHLSDNSGYQDNNEAVTPESWFWNHLIRGLDYYSLEIYRQPIAQLIAQQEFTTRMLAN
jgi:sugar phosphate isomerase/epimerase